ncbi:hypothetical protein S2091_2682 [Solimicrobium silvestre]|uniref:Uncharacterized protein n=2 Tax=Solimicrobium silvestre TaxID=2099400 RepID=A0A2S9GY25_9BURK|nr:hypothetical protein S2091_2682 [Solimicrobium silvestre]
MYEAMKKSGVLPKRTAPITPSNPSRKATARVRNPLPIPTICPHCKSAVELVNNSEIYGREYGEWPWAYRCEGDDCDSYVGLHPFTNIPLGTLANEDVRDARKKAKNIFNPIWQSRGMTRSAAYAWLAEALGIQDVNECHIGWFDVETCERVFALCNDKLHAV